MGLSKKFVLLYLLMLSISCKKQPAVCTGNCDAINISGYIFDNVSNTNAGIVPISLDWVKFGGLIATQKNILSAKTKNDGTFNSSSGIDTTLFSQGYFLSLKVADNDAYITLPGNGVNDQRMYDYEPKGFTNLRFDVYPKTILKIKLNRVQNDNFQYFQVAYYFIDNAGFFPFEILTPGDIDKTSLNVPTSINLYTKIRVTKRSSAGVNPTTVDSIKCTKNGANSYIVNF